MARGPCPENLPTCKYFPECFSDSHHIYGKARARSLGRMVGEFVELPENKVQICRAEHDEIHATGRLPSFPDFEIIKMALEEHRNGQK